MSHANRGEVVYLSPDRWAALIAALGSDLRNGGETCTVEHGITIDGILFLPAVYRAA